jgi:uncharacterized protein
MPSAGWRPPHSRLPRRSPRRSERGPRHAGAHALVAGRIPRAAWNGLVRDGNPFLHWDYLEGLERSGAVSEETGWRPCHLVVEEAGQLLAAMPLYLKDHSWGEFVFDFAWADAYRRAGVPYYPKLVAAVPFTPVPGPRILTAPGVEADVVGPALLDAARGLAGPGGRILAAPAAARGSEQLPLLHAAG